MEEATNTAATLAAEFGRIREAAKQFLVPKEGSEEAKDNARMATAYYAVEVVCSIFNVFASLRSPNSLNTFMAVSDLTISLNTNPFWVRNAGHLTPLLIAAVNAANDAREIDAVQEPRWKSLKEQCENNWLDILPTIVFLTHGQAIMRITSVEMKKTFLGLIYG